MANEFLSGSTTVIYNDIPQTRQESFISDSVIIYKNIPMTVQESFISNTLVLGQNIDIISKSRIINTFGMSDFIPQVISSKFFNNLGIMKIKIPNSQLCI